MAPPLISTVVSVHVPVAVKPVNVPLAAELAPITAPSIAPPLISTVPAVTVPPFSVTAPVALNVENAPVDTEPVSYTHLRAHET